MKLGTKRQQKWALLCVFGWFWLPVTAVGTPAPAPSQKTCPSKVYSRADAALVRARRDWLSLYHHRQAYPACDDGALAEGYSDAVARLIARRWDRIDEFSRLAERHPAFGRWVIRHIDESAAQDDLARIVRNSANCRQGAPPRKLCAAMQQAARRALSQ